jgi:hypothetical protein
VGGRGLDVPAGEKSFTFKGIVSKRSFFVSWKELCSNEFLIILGTRKAPGHLWHKINRK